MMTEWSLDDKSLTTPAPVEGSAVYRMYKNGINSQEVMRRFKLRGTAYLKLINAETAREAIAVSKGLPVHDGMIPKEYQ